MEKRDDNEKLSDAATDSITTAFFNWKYTVDGERVVPDRKNPPKIEGLKPCPFCGSDDLRVQITRDSGHGGGPMGLSIWCGCGASKEVDEYNHKWEDLPELLKERWNRRG